MSGFLKKVLSFFLLISIVTTVAYIGLREILTEQKVYSYLNHTLERQTGLTFTYNKFYFSLRRGMIFKNITLKNNHKAIMKANLLGAVYSFFKNGHFFSGLSIIITESSLKGEDGYRTLQTIQKHMPDTEKADFNPPLPEQSGQFFYKITNAIKPALEKIKNYFLSQITISLRNFHIQFAKNESIDINADILPDGAIKARLLYQKARLILNGKLNRNIYNFRLYQKFQNKFPNGYPNKFLKEMSFEGIGRIHPWGVKLHLKQGTLTGSEIMPDSLKKLSAYGVISISKTVNFDIKTHIDKTKKNPPAKNTIELSGRYNPETKELYLSKLIGRNTSLSIHNTEVKNLSFSGKMTRDYSGFDLKSIKISLRTNITAEISSKSRFVFNQKNLFFQNILVKSPAAYGTVSGNVSFLPGAHSRLKVKASEIHMEPFLKEIEYSFKEIEYLTKFFDSDPDKDKQPPQGIPLNMEICSSVSNIFIDKMNLHNVVGCLYFKNDKMYADHITANAFGVRVSANMLPILINEKNIFPIIFKITTPSFDIAKLIKQLRDAGFINRETAAYQNHINGSVAGLFTTEIDKAQTRLGIFLTNCGYVIFKGSQVQKEIWEIPVFESEKGFTDIFHKIETKSIFTFSKNFFSLAIENIYFEADDYAFFLDGLLNTDTSTDDETLKGDLGFRIFLSEYFRRTFISPKGFIKRYSKKNEFNGQKNFITSEAAYYIPLTLKIADKPEVTIEN